MALVQHKCSRCSHGTRKYGMGDCGRAGCTTPLIHDHCDFDASKVEYGMLHLKARNPETTLPTGECGQMGEELAVTEDPTEVTCPQCNPERHALCTPSGCTAVSQPLSLVNPAIG